MADRELPPLRVRLIGDDSSYRTMMERASRQADELARHVAATSRRAASGGGNGFFNAAEQAIFNRMRAEETSAQILERYAFRRMQIEERRGRQEEARLFAQMQIHDRIATRREAAARREADRTERRLRQEEAHVQRMANMQATQQRAANAAQQRSQQSAQSHQQRMANMQAAAARAAAAHQQRSQQSAQMHQQRMRASQSSINRQNALAWNRLRQSQQRHAQVLFNSAVANRRQNAAAQQRLAAGAARMQQTAAQAAQNLNNSNALAQQRLANAQMTQYRQNAGFAAQQARLNARHQQMMNRPRGGGGGFGGGGGLAGRADIYMGMHAIRGVMGAVAGPAQDAMDWQDANIALTAYTGSAEKAGKTLEEIQKFALASPYSSKVLIDNAKSMMSYGISAENTLRIQKQLGNVAGGNAERMHLLSYAMAQVNSTGILQGQELRQLTESGFNPLMVMAKDMTNTEEEAKKKFIELRKAMADGKITSEMVAAALQNVTAKGGMFAGLLDKLNDSTRGLTNQLLEYLSLIQRNIFAAIQEELDKFLKTGVAVLKMISDWIAQNPALAKTIGRWIWNAMIAVTVVLALTVAMAGLRWAYHTLVPVIWLVTRGFWLMVAGATAAWTAITSPIGIVIAAIAAVGIAIAAIIAYFYHPGGIIGAFGDMMSMAQMALNNTIGFFWNFGDNMKILFGWLYQNWSQMWTNMFASMRVTWNNISGWLADQILNVSWMFGGLTDEQLKSAKEARASATTAENKQMSSGVKALPAMNLNTTLPSLEFPKYESQVTPIEEKEVHDWEAMMGKGKDAAGNGGKGAGSTDIKAAARGSSEAEQRARAFMAGNRNVTSGDPKAKREARMEKFLKQIEQNTRQPTAIPVATIT